MSGNKFVYTKKVYEQNGSIIRAVKDILEAKKILDILAKHNLLGHSVVATKVFSEDEKLLTHENLECVIYSEEYTQSMAYDVAKKAIELSLLLLKDNVYCWDMFPHNFTYNNSKWILYDFDALSLKPDKIKTLIRGFYKIVFSSFEFLKRVERKDLQQCFLNRIKTVHLLKMIPKTDWYRLFFTKNYCFLLYRMGLYRQVYIHLLSILKSYKSVIKREEYDAKLSQLDTVRFNHINSILNNNNIDRIFCVGETASKWAVNTHNSNIRKVIYAGDYELTDKLYNTVIKNNLKNITIGELFPLSENEKIPSEYKYRALYDVYTKMRITSSAAMFLNDIPENQSIEEFLCHFASFANKLLIVHFSEKNKQRYYDQLSVIYNKVDFIYSISLIIAYDRKVFDINKIEEYHYTNYNRGDNSLSQTEEIMQILKKN